jgi:HTH-type transcriptional regulator, sugar sensing transcriptional regulator
MKNGIIDLQDFTDLGLSERESSIYKALLSKKAFTATELKGEVNIPSTKIYDVLQRMVKKGIVIERPVDSLKYYEAVDPELAFKRLIERYKNEYENDLDRKLKAAESLTKKLSPLFEDNRNIDSPLDFIEILKDSEYIQKRFINKYVDSKQEVLSFTKGPFIASNSSRLRDQLNVQENFLKRGGRSRAIYQAEDLLKYEWLYQSIKDIKGSGEEVRIVESLPIKMLIFDCASVMLPLRKGTNESSMIVSVWIEHPELATACKILFETFWEKGLTLEQFEHEFESKKEIEI